MWRPLPACFPKLWIAAVLFSMTALCSAISMGSKLLFARQEQAGSLEKDGLGKVFLSMAVISRGIKGLQQW